MKELLEKVKDKVTKENVKKVVVVGVPFVTLTAIAYYGLKTSKDVDYKDYVGE